MITLCLLFACFALGVFLSRFQFLSRFSVGRLFLGALLMAVMVMSVACGTLGAITAMIPSIASALTAILTFIAGLKGGEVSAAVNTAIAGWVQKSQDALKILQQIITDAAGNATASVFTQISGVLNDILGYMNSLLADFNVTDAATVKMVTGLVALAIAAINGVLAVVQAANAVALKLAGHQMTDEQLKAADGHGKAAVEHAHKNLQDGYKALIAAKTGEPDVDAAVAALPQSI